VQIRQDYPAARIIVLTTFDGDEDIYRALQAGARAYLLKGMFGDELMDAIRAVHAGKSRIPPAVAERLANRMGGPGLTPRELDVLRLIVSGNSNKEIGISRRHLARHSWSEVEHTMLHEMVHQWQAENGYPVDHGPVFRAKAREVGVLPAARRNLGLSVGTG
jgi:FixJ family two-component response regulator